MSSSRTVHIVSYSVNSHRSNRIRENKKFRKIIFGIRLFEYSPLCSGDLRTWFFKGRMSSAIGNQRP